MKQRRKLVAQPQRVVGIGASAGGLEALQQLVGAIPEDSGLAFVVLQHLPPSQTGQLAQILARATALPVIDIDSGHRIQPNTILVVPPHTSASLYRGAFVLRAAKTGARPHLPIDGLFGSLADVLGARAVGVVLSGTGSDGTEGLRAIQSAGGLTFAQDPADAQFDAMPRSAIAAGVAHANLTAAEIGKALGAIPVVESASGPRPKVVKAPAIDRVLDQLREASGIDFSSYKRSTIERRLTKRLGQHRLKTLDEYSSYLAAHPEEATLVYEDLLIHVTEFFRDRPVGGKLAAQIIPGLVHGKPADVPIRVWVPGCSTGEEVYSLAIAILEQLGDHGRGLQLFGTDLSEHSIDVARRGHYPESIAARVGEQRLARFFRREDGGYRINRDVRERCVFVRHDLVTDPPFSKLDLVSCRNVLIYLGPALQKRVISVLHYALNQPGYLVLGRAESIIGFERMFAPVDAEAKIYARRPGAKGTHVLAPSGKLGRLPWQRVLGTVRSTPDVQRDVDHVLLARYAPACVLVDENLDVVQFRGLTGMYLEQPAGPPQVSLLRLAREGLAGELPIAIERARRTDSRVRRENIVIRHRGHHQNIHLEVIPVRGTSEAKRYFLVVFEEATAVASRGVRAIKATKPPKGLTPLVRAQQELDATKEYLHSVVTQHRALAEDLGTANEELQSTNEELQSSNEELQTAKEELQSANEELETVNEQLQGANRQLGDLNDDLVNVIDSVEIAIIIVDLERRVRRFTPAAQTMLQLLPGDVGRPLNDIRPSAAIGDLDEKIEHVMRTLEAHEQEVEHPNGSCYRMQIRPYRTVDDKVSGAVIAFVDITVLRHSLQESRAARDHAAAIVETVPTPLVVLDDQRRIVSANRAFHAAFAAPELTGQPLLELGQWQAPELGQRLKDVLANGTTFDDVHAAHTDANGERVFVVSASAMPSINGNRGVLVALADITEQAAAARERDAFLDAVSHELRTPLSAILLWAEALRDPELDAPRRQRGIDTIIQSARSEAQLVDDLLELSVSRSGQLSVNLELADAAAIVESAVAAVRGEAADKKIAIETALARGPHAEIDPRRLQQITTKLLANAVKFTPSGGCVSVALTFEDHALELSVCDTGPGIPAGFLDRAFEPFSQADRSTTRAHPGLGIGLALVRHFVERQGGTIAVATNGEGTAFKVRLPSIAS